MKKQLLSFAFILLAVSSLEAATFECARINGQLIPQNDNAVRLAEHLGVSSCNGDRFKLAVEHVNGQIDVVQATDETRQAVEQRVTERRQRELEGLPSFN